MEQKDFVSESPTHINEKNKLIKREWNLKIQGSFIQLLRLIYKLVLNM